MAGTPVYLSPTNGFIPQATGQAIAYVRDPKVFKLNEYVQLVRSPKPVGAYAVLDPDQPARVPTDAEFHWAPGNPRPQGNDNLANFTWQEFRCFRRDFPWGLDEQSIEAAEGWNPKAFFNAIILQQAMTLRTANFMQLVENSANWPATNFAPASSLNNGAGKWNTASNDETSPNFLAIKKSLLEAVRRINLLTNSVVTPDDLVLVIGPDLALAMSETSEIHTYLEKQANAIKVIRGEDPEVNGVRWALPERLYGVKVVVEDASIVTARPVSSAAGATTAALGTGGIGTPGVRSYCKQPTSAVLVSRKGGIDGNFGSPSFSTLQLYYYKYEMAVEAFDDPKNKRLEAHVVDQYAYVIAAGRAGFLIQNTL